MKEPSITLTRTELAALLSTVAKTALNGSHTLEDFERRIVQTIETPRPTRLRNDVSDFLRSYQIHNQAKHAWEWLAEEIIKGSAR